MDLSEVRGSEKRHPWETARAVAIERVLRHAKAVPHAILDFGCGDGYTGEHILSAFRATRLLGFDIHLTNEKCQARSIGKVKYENAWARTANSEFDLCLMCDVIEHVEDEDSVLSLVRGRLRDGGAALVTVPAFQSLYTNHDRALKHFRRYTLQQLEQVMVSRGFAISASGYLFASLLPGRGLMKLGETVRPSPQGAEFGIGAWTGSSTLTRALEVALNWDNSFLLGLAWRGIKLPGLSAWALCKKLPS